jgi:TonB family protein
VKSHVIHRFLLVSVLVHVVVIAVIVARPHVQWTIPAPALSVNLDAGATVKVPRIIQRGQAADNPKARAIPVSAQSGMSAATASASSAGTDPLRDDRTRANHLLAMLQAAIDQHFMYPPLAERHGWEGKVRVGVRLNSDGHINTFHVTRSSGYALLDQDALLTLERISSLPDARAWLNGHPYEAEITIDYRLIEG